MILFWRLLPNSDDSAGNNDIVGDNEGQTAVIFSMLRESKVFMIQM